MLDHSPRSPHGYNPRGSSVAMSLPFSAPGGATAGSRRAGGDRKEAEEPRCLSSYPDNSTERFFLRYVGVLSHLSPPEGGPYRDMRTPTHTQNNHIAAPFLRDAVLAVLAVGFP